MSTKRKQASAARLASTAFVLDAAGQRIDPRDQYIAEQLRYIIDDMSLLALSIEALADDPCIIGTSNGVVLEGFDARRVREVRRLAGWISEIGMRAVTDYDERTRSA